MIARLLSSQFLRFAGVGALGYFVDAGVLSAVLVLAPGQFYWGRACSYLAAASFGWFLNRHLTFKSGAASWREWVKYLVANLGGGVANYAVYAVLVANLPIFRTYPALAVGVGSVSGLALNFTASRRFVFRQRPKDGIR